MRRLWLVPLMTLVMISGPQLGVACSCVPSTKAQLVENATVIFTGVATGVGGVFGLHPACTTSSADPVFVTLSVDTVYKGEAPATVTVRTAASGASCGYEFAAGKRYTVFATTGENGLETNLCRGNVEGAITPAEYGLPAGHAPKT